jgi:lipoate-protein ligase A
MRLPRHDTAFSLSAETAPEALSADEACLDAEVAEDRQVPWRWWVATAPAVVVGVGMKSRLTEIVDFERCAAAGIDVLSRRAGGGALLLNEHMLCGAVCLPPSTIPADVTESYRWLGERFVAALRSIGVSSARRVEIVEARADVRRLRDSRDTVSKLLLATCYGALSPHEVVAGEQARKLVGLAQVRRRRATLYQFGVLLDDQSALADYLRVDSESDRDQLRAALACRTVGLTSLTGRSASEAVEAIVGAMPSGQ